MIGLMQRVSRASVSVNDAIVGEIGRGLLVLVGIERVDDEKNCQRMAERLLGYRVFPDAKDRMNLSLADISGELLLVPQFTLVADTRKGTRASFARGAPPDVATGLFDTLLAECRSRLGTVEKGHFGADMQVSLVNDGPVTFWLQA